MNPMIAVRNLKSYSHSVAYEHTCSDALKAASDLLQFTTEKGHEKISKDAFRVLSALEDFKLKQTCK